MSRFRIVEIDLINTTPLRTGETPAHGMRPHGTLARVPTSLETTETLRFSDLGYVDEGHRPYHPLVTQAFDVDRGISLTSDALGGTSTFGSITLINDGSLDGVITQWPTDHLPVRILSGEKTHDRERGIWIDPPRADLQPVFGGLGSLWQPGRRSLTIPLLGALSWLSVGLVSRIYGGAGGLDGDSNVLGQTMPILRGTALNLTPVLIDAANDVYQVSDGPAHISALYEGGFAGGIAFAGTVSNLYAQSPAPGTYLIQSGQTGTWIRLGTKPVYGITVDAFGSFPSGAAPTSILDILRQMLLEDFLLPEAYLDTGWDTVSGLAPWAGGWFWSGTDAVTGQDVVRTLLSGLGLSIVSTRTGTLLPIQLAVPWFGQDPDLILTADQITEIEPVALDTSLSPPTWRWRIGWGHNFTVQTTGSGLHPQAPSDRQAVIATSDRYAVWARTSLRSRWRVPNDPAPVVTALSDITSASSIAESHGQLWGDLRTLWAVTVPADVAWKVDLGSYIAIQAPVPGLTAQTRGLVVSEHARAGEATVTLQVLVIGNTTDPAQQGDFLGDIR